MKRILSLDGGGIRGVFSLQILRRIESLFREREGASDLVLADVFDLFAGTSTGAIIATCLCWGMSVDEIERLYLEENARMFSRSPWFRRFRAKYRSDRLADMFRVMFSEDGDGRDPVTLGTNRLRKLLLVVVRNASTGSPWPLTNNPRALFNDSDRPECNLEIPLWRLLRGSTAAPTYFAPETITLGEERFLFVDGGVTPYNNPALLAVLQATLPQYRIGWPASREELHVISVGTGGTRAKLPRKPAARVTLLDHLGYVPPAIIGSAMIEQDMLCRIVGDCLHGAPLDVELGHLMEPTLLPAEQQKFTYVRYDQRIDAGDDKTLLPPLMKAKLDDLRLIPKLQELGQRYAEQHVAPEHLDPRERIRRDESHGEAAGIDDLNPGIGPC